MCPTRLCSRKYNLNWGLQQLCEVWTKNFKTSVTEEDDVEMTGDGEGSVVMRMTLRNRCVLPISPTRQMSESHHFKHRLISLRGGFWKNQLCTSRMTTSVNKAYLNIRMTSYQDTHMLSERTLMSLGCGDSSMVSLDLEEG